MNTPEAPDPYKTAAAQTDSNKQTALTQQELNQTNQVNPYGSLTYSQSGTNADGTPQFTATQTLSPQAQALFDKYMTMRTGQAGAATNLMNSGAGAFSGKGLDLSYDGTAAALDALNRKRLDPQWQQNTDMQEAKLAAQGLQPGMPGYDRAMAVFNQGKNDAYNSANLADYGQAIAAKQAEYLSPVQAYTALTSGTQPTMPNTANVTTPTANVAGTNIAGLIQDNYKNQLSQSNSAMGGLFGLGGTVLGSVLGGPIGGSIGGSLGSAMGGLFGGGGGGLASGSAFNNPNMNSSYYGPLN